MSDFLSFDEAMRQLGLGAEKELDDIVSNGGLRAFRDGDEVRFKKEDVINLKRSRETEPTIVLSDTQAERLTGGGNEEPIDLDSLSTDETVLNIEGLLEDETEGTTPIPGVGILESDDEIIGSIGEDTVLDTDGLDLGDDLDLTDDDTILADDMGTLVGGSGVRSVQMVKKQSHAFLTATLALTLVLMIAPAAILMNLSSSTGGSYPQWIEEKLTLLNPVIESILGLF